MKLGIGNHKEPFWDVVSDGLGSNPQTADEIFGFLSQDDNKDEPPAKDDKSDKTPKDNKDADILNLDEDESNEDDDQDEDEDSEEDDQEDSDEDSEEELKLSPEEEDEAILSKIPTRAEIKAKYPNIFKEFKALDHIFYRERAYAEIYPSVKDAQESKELVDQFNNFQSELFSGNIEGTLAAVKKADPKAFDKITNNLLDSLVRIDANSHLGITNQITKGILHQINSLAEKNLKKDPNNKQAQQVQIAAQLIHDVLYNTTEITPYNKPAQEDKEDPEKTKLQTERNEFDRTRFNAAFSEISTGVQSILTKAVERDIDTKNILTPYVKTKLVGDIMTELDRQLMSDNRFKSLVTKLYQKAKESGYSEQSKNNIKTALKEKARTILPAIMRAKKGEAMKGLASSGNKDGGRKLSLQKGKRDNQTKTRSQSVDDKSKPRDDESVLEYLSRD